MHHSFLVYFVNRYMFRAYLGPLSRGRTVCIQQLVLILKRGKFKITWAYIHNIKCVKYDAVVYRLGLKISVSSYVINL
jgi:hypothetical protein